MGGSINVTIGKVVLGVEVGGKVVRFEMKCKVWSSQWIKNISEVGFTIELF